MKHVIILFLSVAMGLSAFGSGDHNESGKGEHAEEKEHDDHEGHDEKESESGHAHEEEGEEESAAVGPDKGITEKGENGFKLSPEAVISLGIKQAIATGKVMDLPVSAIIEIKNSKSIYRLRQSWIKRSPIKVLKKTKQLVTVEILDYQAGDEVVTEGGNYLRSTELVAEEGVSHGH